MWYDMIIKDFVKAFAVKHQMTQKAVKNLLEDFINGITEGVKDGKEVRLTGLGCFRPVRRNARIAYNPQNREQTINIPTHNVVSFRPTKSFKQNVRESAPLEQNSNGGEKK